MARRIRPTSGPLDPRAQAILQAVIDDYVTHRESGRVAGARRALQPRREQRHRPGDPGRPRERRPADPSPHVGAGRVPTDAGYRTTSSRSSKLGAPPPPVEQLMIRHQFGQVEFASEHWFRLAATTLASMTRSAGLATPAKPTAARVRRIDLVAIQDRLASLILVLREGTIKQGLIALDLPGHPGRPDPRRQPASMSALRRADRDRDRWRSCRASSRPWRRRGEPQPDPQDRRADHPHGGRVRLPCESRRSTATACST